MQDSRDLSFPGRQNAPVLRYYSCLEQPKRHNSVWRVQNNLPVPSGWRPPSCPYTASVSVPGQASDGKSTTGI